MRHRAGAVATAILLVFGARVLPQNVSRPQFEIASIRPDHDNSPVSMGAGKGEAGGRNVTLRMLIGLAYRVQEFQITGGPAWIGSDRFDVEGKSENPAADPDQLRLMLQDLLENRFQLRLHRETKRIPAYALVVAKSGPRIRLAPDQSPAVDGPAPPGAGPNHGAIRLGSGTLTGNAVTLSLFTRMLSQRLGRTVLDQTNLPGRYDIQLRWNPDVGESPTDPGGNRLPDSEPSGPSLFSAVQEQLGLKLESTRAPVEVLVIEHVERASAN